MCEQTEINYLDGDIVWVKLGACWWPGQVTGFHNLPEDIQNEFEKKPLIAAVKFFQEDTYEFVKNYQQIYKYNCTLKDEFIKKGLDKYRSKSKDGASYMDKFPGDVEMAEKLTGGDPDILNKDKFSPDEKPDISALFGDKKIAKKKREREDSYRRSDGAEIVRKITHPRFLRESDHEVRIRQQPSSLSSTTSIGSPQYPCPLCNFTSSRVNVIICHVKSHRSGNLPVARARIKSFTQQKSRISDSETPKRKYVKKEKSPQKKHKSESGLESGKRKQVKQNEKANKKKKTDSELRQKLLADWEDESEEEMGIDHIKSLNMSSMSTSPAKDQSTLDTTEEGDQAKDTIADGSEIIEETEKLLKETEKLTSINMMEDSLNSIHNSKSSSFDELEKKFESEKDKSSESANESESNSPKEKDTTSSENKSSVSDRNIKKSELSCFDFDEDDLPEPSIPPVRKIPRVFGEKNLFLKKEIIKEFEMSQALKTEQEKESENDDTTELPKEHDADVKNGKVIETVTEDEESKGCKKDVNKDNETSNEEKQVDTDNKEPEVAQKSEVKTKAETKTETETKIKTKTKTKTKTAPSQKDKQKTSTNACEPELEIVEIFEVEKDEGNNDNVTTTISAATASVITITTAATTTPTTSPTSITAVTTDTAKTVTEEPPSNTDLDCKADDTTKDNTTSPENKSVDKKEPPQSQDIITNDVTMESSEPISIKETDETLSEQLTTETEDETVSESADTIPEQSENSDIDTIDQERNIKAKSSNAALRGKQDNNNERSVKKRRGRPRKTLDSPTLPRPTSESESIRLTDKTNKRFKVLEKFEAERKTSESDTERSSSGRKRKPNKKYLESNLYVQDAEKAFKTDESQSESDDKVVEKIKRKPRKGKKTLAIEMKNIELTEQIKEQELKLSEQILQDVAEDNTKSDMKDDINLTPKSKADKGKEFVGLEKLMLLEDQANLDFSGDLQDSEMMSTEHSDSDMLSETMKLPTTEEAILETIGATRPEPIKIKKQEESSDVLDKKEVTESESKSSKEESVSMVVESEVVPEKIESPQQLETSKTSMEMLPPKKSQIKKFELSQIDFLETSTPSIKTITEAEFDRKMDEAMEMSAEAARIDSTEEIDDILGTDKESTEEKVVKSPKVEIAVEEEAKTKVIEDKPAQQIEDTPTKDVEVSQADAKPVEKPTEPKSESTEVAVKDTSKVSEDSQKRTAIQTRYKGKFTPETGAKSKKDKDLFSEEKPVNTFQEAFLKTLQMDKKKGSEDSESPSVKGKKGKKINKKKSDEQDNLNTTLDIQEKKIEGATEKAEVPPETVPSVQAQGNLPEVSVMSNFEGVEVVVEEIDAKVDDAISNQLASSSSPSSDFTIISKPSTQSPIAEDSAKTISMDVQKVEETSKMSPSTPPPSPDVNVPVKKREMPRIIENITLTEPMQILKSKLLDKLPQKGVKHKLESDVTKKGDQRGSPKAKIMKIESLPSNTKMKTGMKVTSPHISLTKKLQVLKAEEAETSIVESQNEKLNIQTSQTLTTTPVTEKYIQQSSQSLADMELDINSMPFVLSEDVLTPESIEQMPVVISSIIPASSSIPATLSFTPTTQMVSPTQTQFKLTNENTTELSPTKKKSGTPTILKNKNKAKPTITSIKTLVPPLTGGVKGVKFQSTQPGKTAPLLTQKGTSGKYVVVQTSGGQQLRYSVQGKTSTQQKIAIPTGKTSGNAQVIQQGGKVIILTSDQSGQTKMLPLNISKTLGGKVQRIMTNKGQVFCPISPQSIVSKTIIAPKGDAGTSTTSKLAPGHKIISTQGIIASKAVLTPIPGTIAKTALLGTLSQGIITKGGVYTPISTSTLGPKTIIGPKTLITGKSATILSSQNLGTSKAILTPITEAITGKTIPSTQRIVSTKATVLTPITGQQVKAIAAKSPSKGSKVQYQSVQQKVQLPMLQKSPKIAVSHASQGRSSGTSLKSASGSLVLQSTQSTPKALQQGKKIIKQTIVQQGTSVQGLSSSASSQQTVSMVPQVQQKGKSVPTSIVQKVIIPRGSGRQSKSQQKIVVQKLQEPAISTVQNTQLKQTLTAASPNVPTVSKSIIQQKQIVGGLATTKSTKTVTNKSVQQQKNLLNLAMNSAATTTTVNTSFSAPLSLPPLEPIEPEKKSKIDNTIIETAIQKEQPKSEKFNVEKSSEVEKVEEPKITAQPQIMALPTESSDGTQTYVLVTIDEQGQIQPLDNNTLMSLEGTTQNPDGTRTLYIDPSSLGEAGTLDNIVLQFDNGVLPNLQTTVSESNQTVISESFPASEVIQTSNQDILAAALANTDFQQEINLPENPAGSVMTTGLTQTSLINQTILQSTIIPPTEPISSPSVLETSLTLNQPIMTPLEVPSSLPIQSDTTPTSVVSTIPSSLELPITITNPNISYISAGEAQIQIPGNSMPDIGEIIESPSTVDISRSKIPASTQYLVIPNLDENITVDTQSVQTGAISMPTVSYSVSIPNNIVLENPQVQTTPSMPIIDDSYSENVQFATPMQASIVTEQTFADVPVSEMLVSKASVASTENITSQDVTVTSEMNIASQDVSVSSQESIVSSNEPHILSEAASDVTMPLQEVYSSQDVPITSKELTMRQSISKEDTICNATITTQEEISNADSAVNTQIVEQPTERLTSSMPIIDEGSLVTESESNVKSQTVEPMNFEVTDSSGIGTSTSEEAEAVDKFKDLTFDGGSNSKDKTSSIIEKQVVTSNEVDVVQDSSQILPTEPLARMNEETMEVEEAVESEIYAASTIKHSEDYQRDEPSSQGESDNHVRDNLELRFEESTTEMNQETPSQSYEQFGIAMTSDSTDLPSQSATKSGNSREPSQSITYEPMETDEETTTVEPPTQSFEHSKMNEASQSYEASAEASTSAPTQSFNEIMQSQEERATVDEAIDDQSFPTQSYDIGKAENIPENLETDAEISQEGNIPSQSNDIGTDGIGTSSVSTNNSGLNEDETASSSYVPETPENQERDQDQESAISTSSYEIPPCEELNIASSSVIPDTSVRAEHTSIHDNGVPEIPTSSYNLNPDITSTHVDSVPTSSYEDQVIVEQNVSTSYEVPISMPGLEETCSQNFVTESTDHRNEPSSYYTHQEVTASYYESVDQESNSKLEEDPQEEVTPSYYERNPQEASQSYFPPEEATPSYSSHNVSPSYYPRPESEASQSYYPADDLEKTEQSSSQNIEASQSFYPEQSDELRLRQQGEATPTYSERYPVDYTLDNSPIERHDLVESSVPATRPTER